MYSLSYNLHNPYYDLVLGGNVYGTQTTSSMAAYMNSQAGYDIIGGVNGDHFSFANGIPLGFSMDDGIIVESPVTDTDADGYMFYSLGVTRDGEVVAGYNPTLIASCQKTDGSASISIDRINRTREWWNGAQLCLFTNRYSSSTHEEAGGRELVIQVTSGSVSPQGGPLRGEVVSVVTSGNAAIGANQVVLSGEGDKATALQQYTVGDEIEMYFRFTDENWNKVDFAIGGNYVIVENGRPRPTPTAVRPVRLPLRHSALPSASGRTAPWCWWLPTAGAAAGSASPPTICPASWRKITAANTPSCWTAAVPPLWSPRPRPEVIRCAILWPPLSGPWATAFLSPV